MKAPEDGGPSTCACDGCLRRAHLIGLLAPRIAGLLDRPGSRAPGLLALPDEELVAAVAGEREEQVWAELAGFEVAAERSRLDRLEIASCCPHAPVYPRLLEELHDPPAVVFSTREPERREDPSVAVVGSRAPSPYGLEVAYSLGRGLGAAGVTVVSGLALGIDAAVHRGCLDAGGLAVAVLAGGADVPYPRQNRRLYERIRESGAIVSELPPGCRPFRWSFPARNRIMAGLAEVTILVEAADPSGSLITAEFARDLGRGVGAVPGRVTSRLAAGTNALLRDGAIVVRDAQDVLDELFGAGVRTLAESRPRELTPPLRAVLDAVEAGESTGAIAQRAGMPAREARVALARLELLGQVARSGIGSYERTARS